MVFEPGLRGGRGSMALARNHTPANQHARNVAELPIATLAEFHLRIAMKMHLFSPRDILNLIS